MLSGLLVGCQPHVQIVTCSVNSVQQISHDSGVIRVAREDVNICRVGGDLEGE